MLPFNTYIQKFSGLLYVSWLVWLNDEITLNLAEKGRAPSFDFGFTITHQIGTQKWGGSRCDSSPVDQIKIKWPRRIYTWWHRETVYSHRLAGRHAVSECSDVLCDQAGVCVGTHLKCLRPHQRLSGTIRIGIVLRVHMFQENFWGMCSRLFVVGPVVGVAWEFFVMSRSRAESFGAQEWSWGVQLGCPTP